MTQDIPFIKMHGLGNDFVIIDLSYVGITLSSPLIQAICNRHTGIGCDQLVTMEPASKHEATALVKFYNSDGTESGACGNASRCVAHLLIKKSQQDQVILQTAHGLLHCAKNGDQITINMGSASLDWQVIPLSKKLDTLHINEPGIHDGVAVNIGNPHLVLFMTDIASLNLQKLGSDLECHSLFPERANINFAQIINSNHIKLRVWERGAGETLACGTGACATVVAAYQRGLSGHHVQVDLPGGTLTIDVQDLHRIHMTGPVAHVFNGTYVAENIK